MNITLSEEDARNLRIAVADKYRQLTLTSHHEASEYLRQRAIEYRELFTRLGGTEHSELLRVMAL